MQLDGIYTAPAREEKMLVQAEHTPITEPLLLAYHDRLQRLNRSFHTLKLFRQTSRKFQEHLAAMGLTAEQVEPWQVDEFFDAMTDLHPSTREGHLNRLGAAYRYAQRRGVVQRDPTLDVEIERVPDEDPVVIDNKTLRTYKARAQTDQDWAAFHLLTYAGLRRCEAIRLQYEQLDFPGTTLNVEQGKGGKNRKVPIHPQLAEALLDLDGSKEGPVIRPLRGGSKIGPDTWSAIIHRLTHGAHTARDFRRTMASSLALNGISDPVIDKIMGWSSRSVGRRYYIKVAGPELQRAVLRLYADDPV